MRWGDYLHKSQVEEHVCVFFFCLVCLCCYVFPPGPTQYIFHTPMAWYSLYVLKVPLNTKQTNKTDKLVIMAELVIVLLQLITCTLLCDTDKHVHHITCYRLCTYCSSVSMTLMKQCASTSCRLQCQQVSVCSGLVRVPGCKIRPAPLPGQMSYKATKPGFVCPVS